MTRALAALLLSAVLLPAPPAGAASAQARRPEFQPYAAVKFAPDLALWAKTTGARRVVLAFYNSDGTGCHGAWQTDEAGLLARVAALKAEGGQAIISTGGWNADDLAARCQDAPSLADVYLSVLERFGVDRIDVDAEAGDLHDNLDMAEVDRRSAALKLVQDTLTARGRRLEASFTLAVSPEQGLDARSLYVLQSAKAAGVRIGVVNAMVMNYRDEPSSQSMAERSIAALEKVRGQLETLLPGRSDRAYWAMIGATAMIGRNDDVQEVFAPGDAAGPASVSGRSRATTPPAPTPRPPRSCAAASPRPIGRSPAPSPGWRRAEPAPGASRA
jgi:chitinase